MIVSLEDISRKAFIGKASGLLGAMALGHIARSKPPRVRAVAFDGYAIFDPTTSITVAESILPGGGRELVAAWRARMFEYQWLRTLGGQYVSFEKTADDALTYTLGAMGKSLEKPDRDRLLESQITLVPAPGVIPELRRLREAGVRIALLSNMSDHMLESGLRQDGLRAHFDAVLSTDRVRAAKPDARAYRMGPSALDARPEEIGFVAFAPWDAAGASWFGYRTIWLNRAGIPPEQLGATADLVCKTLTEATSYLVDAARAA